MSRQSTQAISRLELFWKLVLIFSLWQFAFSQPLLDLLGRTPAFFVAHGTRAPDLILFTLLCTLAVPAAACAFLWLVLRVHRKAFEVAYLLLLGGLFCLIVLPHTHFLESYHRYLTIAATLLVTLGLVALIARSETAGDFTKFLAIAIIAVPLNFLLLSPASKILNRDTSTVDAGIEAGGEAEIGTGDVSGETGPVLDIPVVLVLFDALPLSSLMTADETMDGERFPAFAELAATATWYRNAITLSDSTSMAVPGILAGTKPEQGRIPTPEDYPGNLFSLLHGKAALFAHESLTNLCPDTLCLDTTEAPFGERFRLLLDDSAIAYLHYLLPTFLKGDMPSIQEQWQGFRTDESAAGVQGEQRKQKIVSEGTKDLHSLFRENIAQIEPRDRAAFYFQHVMAPHVPWRYLPSGKEYGIKQRAGLSAKGLWTSQEWLVTQAYQRHLLQLGMVDGLVGELLDHLKSRDMFDDALVIVTADHGASFYPGGFKRAVRGENRVDIGNVPLLVKYPGQSVGKTVDRMVRSIDIAPTIAALLGLPPGEHMDGMDLRAIESGEFKSVQVHRLARPSANITLEDIRLLRMRTILRKERLFPRGGHGADDWFFPKTEHDVVGKEVAELLGPAKSNRLTADIWQKESFQNVDLTAQVLPLRTMGRLSGLSATDSVTRLAIALNGRVAAVTWSYSKEDAVLYSAMLPESYLRAGDNEIAVYAIQVDGGGSVTLSLLDES